MTTPDIQSLVESVLRLDKEATKGPWFAVKSGHRIRIHGPFHRPYSSEIVPCGAPLHHLECWESKTGAGRGQSPTWLGFTKEQVADMDLAATYRTAAPILARACNEKDAELTRLRAELAEEKRKHAESLMRAIDVATGHGDPMPSLYRVEEHLRAALAALTTPTGTKEGE